MALSREFADFLLDQLMPLGAVSMQRMFGCMALMQNGLIFALIDADEQLYVKADDLNRAVFEDEGCARFTYTTTRSGEKTEVALPYYALPEGVLENQDELIAWTRLGLEAAARAPSKPRRKRKQGQRASAV